MPDRYAGNSPLELWCEYQRREKRRFAFLRGALTLSSSFLETASDSDEKDHRNN